MRIVRSYLIGIWTGWFIQKFMAQLFWVASGSMEDTLHSKDLLLVSKLTYRLRNPRFQEVVLFRVADFAASAVFVKRCAGVPGDVVYARDRRYYRNGQVIHEPYARWDRLDRCDMKIVDGQVCCRPTRLDGVPGQWQQGGTAVADQERIERARWEESKVPANCFLVLGDHRDHSSDSRKWGFVPRRNIVGKAICVFWPLTRLGEVN